MAGRLLIELAAQHGARSFPDRQRTRRAPPSAARWLGGEVRAWCSRPRAVRFAIARETFASIRPEDALRHPTWTMGAKISIDSATLVNKGLELIEATHLFGVPAERIDVVVHPQSILHSFVEFCDGSLLAQLSVNDMIFPIQYALAWPERWENEFPRLPLEGLGALELLPLDETRFPAVALARRAVAQGESAPAVFNAANEVAVTPFSSGACRSRASSPPSKRCSTSTAPLRRSPRSRSARLGSLGRERRARRSSQISRAGLSTGR